MFNKNITVDIESNSFKTPITPNHSDTVPIAQFSLGFDTLQCHHNIITNIKIIKYLLLERIIFVFKLMEELTKKHSVSNQGHWKRV